LAVAGAGDRTVVAVVVLVVICMQLIFIFLLERRKCG
jgi:hypothetical protein